jgi:hypothetical protein
MVRKFTDDSAFDNLSQEAKEVKKVARYLEQHKITPRFNTEVIWLESESRSEKVKQEGSEFWLVAEGIDIQNDNKFRTDGKFSTFIYQDFLSNTLILDNVFSFTQKFCRLVVMSLPQMKSQQGSWRNLD